MFGMPFPHPFTLPVVLAGYCVKKIFGGARSCPRTEVVYEELSAARKMKAWQRADSNGYVFLGRGKRSVCTGLSWFLSEKNIVCRVENNELHFYTVDSASAYFNGNFIVTHLAGDTLKLRNIQTLQAWYEPLWGSVYFKIDMGTDPELGPDYVYFQSDCQSKNGIIDALIILTEAVLSKRDK